MPYPHVITPVRRKRCAIVVIGDRVVGVWVRVWAYNVMVSSRCKWRSKEGLSTWSITTAHVHTRSEAL